MIIIDIFIIIIPPQQSSQTQQCYSRRTSHTLPPWALRERRQLSPLHEKTTQVTINLLTKKKVQLTSDPTNKHRDIKK